MKILIIGGTRHIGPATARELLAHGHEVALLHRGTTKADLPEQVDHLLCDARDKAAVEDRVSQGGFDAVMDTILRADDLAWYLPLLARYTGQLVHCGSTGVYAPAGSVPVREDDPTPCPPELGGFGGKLAQDEALLAFHAETGFKTCSLRVSNVFGAGDVPLDVWGSRNPAYWQRVADGEEIWIPNDGRALLQPVHVADLARGFRAALESDQAAGQIFNLSSERAVTLSQYVDLAKELLSGESPVKYVPMEDLLATGKPNDAGLRFVCEHMSIDNSKAARELGYAPQLSIRQGLRDSLRWMAGKGLLKARVSE